MQRGIVWIVDDDSSIRWVLERALTGAGLSCATFEGGNDVLEALATQTPRRAAVRYPHAGYRRPGAAQADQTAPSDAAGDHHDRAFGFGRRRQRLSARGLRLPAEAVRHRRSGGAGRARHQPLSGAAAAGAQPAGQRSGGGHHRRSAGDAGRVSHHRPAVAFVDQRVDQRRIRHRQGNWWRMRCTATARAPSRRSSP